ncbi:MAG: hypothetical protein ACLPL5_04285 [Stellaceae bacterium]|jgi:hypothetical protein
MSETVSFQMPPRVPPVEPELLSSAIYLFSEYLDGLSRDVVVDEDGESEPVEIDTRAVLDLIAENLGTGVTETLALFLRVTALFRLLAAVPSLARLAIEEPAEGGMLTETALVAAARLDLSVRRAGKEGSADYDPKIFRDALEIE